MPDRRQSRRPRRTTARRGSREAEGGRPLGPGTNVAEVMRTEMFTLTPDTGVAAALRFAHDRNAHHFLVIDDGSLTGIVCDSDLRQAHGKFLVSECMKTPVLCISPETTLAEAEGIMDENAIGCLPVVTGMFLVGVITRERLTELDWDRDVQTRTAGLVRAPSSGSLPAGAEDAAFDILDVDAEGDVIEDDADGDGAEGEAAHAKVQTGPEPCVACGSEEGVQRLPRCAFVPLCVACLNGVGDDLAPPKGN